MFKLALINDKKYHSLLTANKKTHENQSGKKIRQKSRVAFCKLRYGERQSKSNPCHDLKIAYFFDIRWRQVVHFSKKTRARWCVGQWWYLRETFIWSVLLKKGRDGTWMKNASKIKHNLYVYSRKIACVWHPTHAGSYATDDIASSWFSRQ